MPRHQSVFRPIIFLLFAVFALVWFLSLVPRHLAKTDEGRYGEIPREMVATGDWLTPRLDGLKYFEKPALQYWATALFFKTLGQGEFTTRLWTGLTGFCGVLLTGFTARRLYGDAAGLYTAAVLASSLLYLLMAHVATLDMGVTFFMNAGLCAALLARHSAAPAQARSWMLAAWAALALAVLSKGLEGIVLPGAVLTVYLLWTRDWTFLSRLEFGRGLVVFLVISAPWFIAVSRANPDFAHFFFIHEHFERFLTNSHHREGPWWYFVPILVIGMLPWVFLLPFAVRVALNEQHLPGQSVVGRFGPARLLLIWSFLIFIFFSVSSSKLPSYILPIFPALAILMGAYLTRVSAATLARLALAEIALGALVIAAGLYGVDFVAKPAASLPDAQDAYARFGRGLAWTGVLWLLGAASGLVLARRGRARAAIVALALAGLFAESAGLVSYRALDRFASAHYVAAVIEPLLKPETRLYSVEMYEQTLPFYLNHTMTLVNQRDELDFGLNQEPGLGIASLTNFALQWRSDSSAIAVMPPRTFDKLAALDLPMRVILRDERFVVVTKP